MDFDVWNRHKSPLNKDIVSEKVTDFSNGHIVASSALYTNLFYRGQQPNFPSHFIKNRCIICLYFLLNAKETDRQKGTGNITSLSELKQEN